ncbi:E3 ubiquitin/ISG15 ligase TRIM25-like [Watersipora subatra]|uniref:E3 ubiquitin/ISG15 ligase TRIM25-like n=1 Tax=Watersipora subatra TaxID=2589382 RepID=UPI00355AE018
MADTDLIGDSRCGYCYQEFSLMRDPRELPCHHAFCLECLKGDYNDQKVVSCPLCNKQYESVEDIDKLPAVKLTVQKEDNSNSTTAAAVICECDDCDNQLAVCYCLQCCRKICAVHRENHISMFKRSHSVVGISDYEVSATKSRKVVCENHDEELSRGCDDCGRLTCNNCEIPPVACTSLKYGHNFMLLSQLKEKITTEFGELLQLVNDKLTEICVVDKQIWRMLDKEEAKCKEEIELIERVCEEQIKRIREESENLKERIRDYQKKLTNQVELYNSELITRKQQLEESRTKVHRHLRYSHVTELVKQREELKACMKRQLSTLNYRVISEPVLVSETISRTALNLGITQLPTSLTFTSKHRMDYSSVEKPLSVCHRSDGGLLVGDGNSVMIISGPPERKTTSCKHALFCPVEHKGVAYGLTHFTQSGMFGGDKNNLEVYQYLLDFSESTLVVSRSYHQRYSLQNPILAVSDEFIAYCDGDNQISIFSILSRQTSDVDVEVTPKTFCFLPNGDLLVTGWLEDSNQNAVLTRYQVEDGKLTTVWTCEGLQDAYGVCESEGLIYVSTRNSKSIFIVSLQGKVLHKLIDEQLPQLMGQISVKDDELAVSGCSDHEYVYIFKINF